MPKITWNDTAVAKVRQQRNYNDDLLSPIQTDFLKLCSAILATADVKLDYQKIADFMGPGKSLL
jgi:hypothetical protein